MLNTLVLALILPVQPQVGFGVGVSVNVPAPTIRFEAEPPLVIVSPGVMVVEDSDSEIFFSNGFYWTWSGGVWYRTRSYRGGWVAVPARRVPYRIGHVRHGTYRHFRGGRPYVRGSAHPGYRHSYRHEDRRVIRDHRDPRDRRNYRPVRGDRRRGGRR
jgi:hypothetical protein